MVKFIQNNLKKIISIISILVIIFVPLLYYSYQENLKEIQKTTWEYWETGDERRGSLVIYYTIQDNREREYLLLDFWNLITQIVYRIETEDYGRKPKIRFETFYLKRTGINSFEVEESIISSSTDFTFEEALEIAKKYDVYKNNPYPDKIANYPDLNLTPEQIQANRQRIQQEQAEENRLQNTPIEELRRDFVFLTGQQLTQEQINAMPPEILQAYDYVVTKRELELFENQELSKKWEDYAIDILGIKEITPELMQAMPPEITEIFEKILLQGISSLDQEEYQIWIKYVDENLE